MSEDMRVWVGCLACYNAGDLHGEWLEPADGPDWECGKPGHEETWVFDHEGFGSFISGECSPLEAARIAEQLDGCENVEALKAYVGWTGCTLETALEDFDNGAFMGEYESGEDFAYELAKETGDLASVPDALECYIDWERVWRGEYESNGWTHRDGFIFCPV